MTGGGGGGLQQCVVPYSLALRQQGHDILAVLLEKSPFVPVLRQAGIDVVTTRIPRKPLPLTWIQSRQIASVAKSFGAEIAVTFASKGLPPTWMALKGKIPVITHCGSTTAKTMIRLKASDGIIVTSDTMQNLALERGFQPDRVWLCPNFLADDPLPVIECHHSPHRIGSLGRLVPRKGFDVLINACGVLKRRGVHLHLSIGGTGPSQPELEKLVHDLGVDVDFLGWLDGAGKARLFSEIDVFAYASRNEPFGLIYLEAMQAGLPVATTQTIGADYIFEAGQTATMAPIGDAEALADAIYANLSDPVAAADRARRAGQVYVEKFHISATAPVLDEIVSNARNS